VELYLHSPNTPRLRGAQLMHRDNFTYIFTLSLRFYSSNDNQLEVIEVAVARSICRMTRLAVHLIQNGDAERKMEQQALRKVVGWYMEIFKLRDLRFSRR
jgi:hypothetical protein